MSAREEEGTPLGYALLAVVVGFGRRTYKHEIVRMIRKRGGALGMSESQIYRDLDRLVAREWLEEAPAELSEGGRRVVSYHRTAAGVEALARWGETTWSIPEIDSTEIVPRIRSLEVVAPKQMLVGLRDFQEALTFRIDDLRYDERQARRNGAWGTVPELESELKQLQLQALLEWTERALQKLATQARYHEEFDGSSIENLEQWYEDTRRKLE